MPRRPSPRPLLLPARVVAALLAALVCVAAVAAPAQASRRTITDAVNDVVKQANDKAPKPAVNYAAADVTTFVASMRQQELVLSTTARKLPRNYWAMLWEVQTDAGVTYDIDLLKTGTVKFTLSSAQVPVECAMTRKADKVKDRVTITVPLTCLGSPATLRVGAGAAATSRSFGRIYTDDAARVGGYSTGPLQLSRPLKRG